MLVLSVCTLAVLFIKRWSMVPYSQINIVFRFKSINITIAQKYPPSIFIKSIGTFRSVAVRTTLKKIHIIPIAADQIVFISDYCSVR